jgi:hypothetical protein
LHGSTIGFPRGIDNDVCERHDAALGACPMSGSGGSFARNADPVVDSGERAGCSHPSGVRDTLYFARFATRTLDAQRGRRSRTRGADPDNPRASGPHRLPHHGPTTTTACEPRPTPNGQAITSESEAVTTRDAQPYEPTPNAITAPPARRSRPTASRTADGGPLRRSPPAMTVHAAGRRDRHTDSPLAPGRWQRRGGRSPRRSSERRLRPGSRGVARASERRGSPS